MKEEEAKSEYLGLKTVCLKQVSKSIEEHHVQISIANIQELPCHLLEDLAPVLSVHGLVRLHPVLQERGIDVQRYWLKFYLQTSKQAPLPGRCPCHDPELANRDWRQKFLDKTCQSRLQELGRSHQKGTGQQDLQNVRIQRILENPLTKGSESNQTQEALDGYSPTSLLLESRLLPHIQSEPILLILQSNLRELVLSHSLPKYKAVLRGILERLIHRGVLRKLTLKHPKYRTPDELLGILEVCAGRRQDVGESDGREHEVGGCLKRKNVEGCLPGAKRCDLMRRCSGSGRNGEDACRGCQGPGQADLDSVGRHQDLYESRNIDEFLPGAKCCDWLRQCSDSRRNGEDARQVYQGLSQKELDSVGRHQDLYDFCFSEPINTQSESHRTVMGHPHPSSHLDTSKEIPTTCPNGDTGSNRSADTVLSASDAVLSASDTRIQSAGGSDTRTWTPSPSPASPCIQHLVLCGFLLEHTFNVWPGLQELEFIDNLMLQETCRLLLSALMGSQMHGGSLQRLRIEDNSVTDFNLPSLNALLMSSELDTLELKATDINFSRDRPLGCEDNSAQYSLDQLGDAFGKLTTLELSYNRLLSLTCLERALLQPDHAIRHLNLEGCQLGTKMLDRFFICAKDCKSLHELNVACNTYCPSLGEQSSGDQASQSGLIQLIRASPLSKLNLSGCRFMLKGWTNTKDFLEALRLNTSLRQLLLVNNQLTNKCLQLLVDAFIHPSADNDRQASKLCLDISYNRHVTRAGLNAFSQALDAASTTPAIRCTPPRHLTISSKGGLRDCKELRNLARFTKLTVSREASNSGRDPYAGREMNYDHLMLEHLSQM